MYRENIRKSVINLREKGKTYSEICRELKVSIPKSTLSCWCKSVQLPKGYEKKIRKMNLGNAQRGRAVALIVNKQRRECFLAQLRKRNLYLSKKVNKDVLKMLLAMIYFCEGCSWQKHRGLSFGNSDPAIIKFYIKLLKVCYPNIITQDVLQCRVNHRADQDIDELNKFWSGITGVPSERFYRSKPDPRTIGKPTKKKDYKGVCVVSSRGTEIQLELEIVARMIFSKFS